MSAIVVTLGELMLRLAPPGQELMLQSPTLQSHWGGAECNVAMALAQFGHEVRFLSALPDHVLGQRALAELRKHQLDTRFIARHTGRLGLYFYSPGAMQRASEVLYDRQDSVFAKHAVSAAQIDAAFEGAAWFHLSGITPALSQRCADSALLAVRSAKAGGIRISFDCNFRRALWQHWGGDARSCLLEIIDEVAVLFADARDIALLLGSDFSDLDQDASFKLASAQAFEYFPNLQIFCSTTREIIDVQQHRLAAQLAQRNSELIALPEYHLRNIVDRIGTGDAFAGGFIHGQISGWNAETSLRFALAAACLKHSIPGDQLLCDAAAVQNVMDAGSLQIKR